MRFRIAVTTILFAVHFVQAAAQPRGNLRYSVVVDQFENKTESKRQLGDELATLLTSKLYESGHFIVVAQDDMQRKALEEQIRANSGGTATGRKTAAHGQMTPVQLLVKGVILSFREGAADQNGGFNVGGVTIHAGQKRTEIRATLQMIDVSTGAIVASKEFIGTSQQRAFSVKRDRGDSVSTAHDDNVQAALSKAITDVIPWMVAQLPSVQWRGSVLEVDSERIIVNRGAREGLSAGDELIVGEAEILRDPDTGEIIDELIHERARIKVVTVSERTAICSLVTGKMGQIVERMAVRFSGASS